MSCHWDHGGDLGARVSGGVRGADAVHLASFGRILATADDDDVRFLCADDRLNKAARNLG